MRDEFDPPPMDTELAARVRFVLVQPTHPGNIGAAARAMKNMGFSELVLVDPLRFPDEEARFRAASAVDIVDRARVVGSLAEAIDDCQLVIGSSARNRRVPWPMIGPREVGTRVLDEAPHGPVAILFGREASGLTNEELARPIAPFRAYGPGLPIAEHLHGAAARGLGNPQRVARGRCSLARAAVGSALGRGRGGRRTP